MARKLSIRMCALALLSMTDWQGSIAHAQSSTLAISGTPPATATPGHGYTFTPQVTGGRGTRRWFQIRGRPAWATFNTRTGTLAGTPGTSHVGSYPNIRISVTDGRSSRALPAFAISVLPGGSAGPTPAPVPAPAPVNRPPTISGTPPGSVIAGQPYTFQPVASDPDGDPIGFGISNKPAWASFSLTTGRLSGTPSAADVGQISNIVIAVSDTKAVETLPAFAIAVVQAANGSITVSWDAPTTNSDGSTLTDLAGYLLQYGPSPDALTHAIRIPNPGITAYVVTDVSVI